MDCCPRGSEEPRRRRRAGPGPRVHTVSTVPGSNARGPVQGTGLSPGAPGASHEPRLSSAALFLAPLSGRKMRGFDWGGEPRCAPVTLRGPPNTCGPLAFLAPAVIPWACPVSPEPRTGRDRFSLHSSRKTPFSRCFNPGSIRLRGGFSQEP